ncbi:MAG: hypothetical protein NVS2B8_06390 [Vulcanimicrobiaceae bacterium]
MYSISGGNLALEAEVENYRALAALRDDDLFRARQLCETTIEIGMQREARAPVGAGFVVVLGHVVCQAYELLSVIDAAQGSYLDANRHVRLALETLDACAVPDVYQEAFALKNLTIVARDFDIADDARKLAQRVPAFAWTDDIRHIEFTTFEALGWCSALRGDCVEALGHFRHADSAATTDPERVIVGVDRALLAREFGHRPMVVEEVQHALKIANRFDWETSAGDTRDALLVLAQVAAPVAAAQARQVLDRYTAIRNTMDITFAARSEPRARAEEAYTHGLVLRAEGRIAASTERLEVAFQTWKAIGYDWRAARAAIELAELNAGDVFRLAVRRELSERPDSIFSPRARLVA